MPAHSAFSGNGLVKHDLADRLRAEIMDASLPSGDRIVEAKWVQKFGVAQGSIREAINILETAVAGMRLAASEGNCEALLQDDLQFHLQLCELSGNPFLVELSHRLLVPFFAFVRMRVATSGQTTSPWDKDLEAHQRLIDLLCEGEDDVRELYVKNATARFAKNAYDN
jgi:DNA-binding GntR family transcriptional regulator